MITWDPRADLHQIADSASPPQIAAGLTSALLESGFDTVAVEPDEAMRAFVPPGATLLAGKAEQIPLPRGTVDAVLVGQAWHWFDQRTALRVLRPGGALGVLWNVFDDPVPWVSRPADLLGAEDRYSANVGKATLLEGQWFQRRFSPTDRR